MGAAMKAIAQRIEDKTEKITEISKTHAKRKSSRDTSLSRI